MEGDKLKKDIPKRPSGIFYIESNRAFYYEENQASPLVLDLTPDIISDLEVVSKKKLESIIHAFTSTYKIDPKSIIVLLSTAVTFDKDFPPTVLEADKGIEEFLELVPFEEYISKQSKFPGKTKIVAANREFCDAVRNSFIALGFVVAGVYPLSFCLEVMPELQENLDLGTIINKSAELRGFNLLPDVETSPNSPKKEKKDNKRLFILTGVFALLMVVLLFVIYRFIILSPKPPKSLPVNTLSPQSTVFKEETDRLEVPQPPESSSTSSADIQGPEAN